MSDLAKLKEMLDNQAERGIRSGDWERLDYKEVKHKKKKVDELLPPITDGITLTIETVEVEFFFSRSGRLIGMYNWKA